MKNVWIAILLVLWGTPAPATDGAKNTAILQSYLNASKGIEASFEQMDANGIRLTGTFYLLRPGRLRFQYDKPSTLQIFADGTWLLHYDGENQEYTTLALSETPASFLVADPINLTDKHYHVTTTDEGKTLVLTLSKKDEPDLGSLTLKFKKDPLTLIQWIVIDGQGLKTVVNLNRIKRHDYLDPALFALPAGISLP